LQQSGAKPPQSKVALDLRKLSSDIDAVLRTPSSLTPKGVSMKGRIVLLVLILAVCLIVITPGSAQTQTTPQGAVNPPRDEKLWQRALQIHRKAIVIDSHNDITTSMTNDDYDLRWRAAGAVSHQHRSHEGRRINR
jgi:hypothetical protein